MGRKRAIGNEKLGIAYLRASTGRQVLSPKAQRDRIHRWAADNGVTIVSWHEDTGVSGDSQVEQRPGLVAALGDLRVHGAGVLVVAKRDRLARDPMVATVIERAAEASGAKVVNADGVGNGAAPADKLLRGILDLVAEYELAVLKGRTKSALRAKRERGERAGELPFGMRLRDDGVHLEPDPEEQNVIARVLALRAQGVSYRAGARQLAAEGVVSPRSGRPLSHTQLHRIIRRAEAEGADAT